MSSKHPIIALTGASGAGRESVRDVFDKLFRSEGILAAYVVGESFHRYNRADFQAAAAAAKAAGNPHFSHFGPDANLFGEQEDLYRTYGATGRGRRRFYLHSEEDAARFRCQRCKSGEFTPWEDLPPHTDVLLYEGLHGVVRTAERDLGRYVDLKIGMVPVINLEWTQKIHRDTVKRGYSQEAVVDNILSRMHDYVHYILPQFDSSDINFQHVPVIDTSDPFGVPDIPTLDERVVVIRFRRPEDLAVDFPWLERKLHGSWMSRRNTLVVPGAMADLAMELVLEPVLRRMMRAR